MTKIETLTIRGLDIKHSIHKRDDKTISHIYSILTTSNDKQKIQLMKYVERAVNRLYNKYNSVKTSGTDVMYHITCC